MWIQGVTQSLRRLYYLGIGLSLVVASGEAMARRGDISSEWRGEISAEWRVLFTAPETAWVAPNSEGELDRQNFARMQVEWGLENWLMDGTTEANCNLRAQWHYPQQHASTLDSRGCYLNYLSDQWHLKVGMDSVYWGQMETRQLVDIVNQQDMRYDLRGEKLDQAMVNFGYYLGDSEIELYLLPFFRSRPFAQVPERPRVNLPIVDSESFASGTDIDFAARWYTALETSDVAFSLFHGFAREPDLKPMQISKELVFEPFYDRIFQLGAEWVINQAYWLWKMEAYYRKGDHIGEEAGWAVGAEYSIGDLESFSFAGMEPSANAYLELIKDEDESGRFSAMLYQDALMVGGRLSFDGVNPAYVQLGYIHDMDQRGHIIQFEWEMLVNDVWRLDGVVQAFNGKQDDSALTYLQDEDWMLIRLSRLL